MWFDRTVRWLFRDVLAHFMPPQGSGGREAGTTDVDIPEAPWDLFFILWWFNISFSSESPITIIIIITPI